MEMRFEVSGPGALEAFSTKLNVNDYFYAGFAGDIREWRLRGGVRNVRSETDSSVEVYGTATQSQREEHKPSAIEAIDRAFAHAGDGLRPNERTLALRLASEARAEMERVIQRAQDRGLPFRIAVDKNRALARAVERLAYCLVADCCRESAHENVTLPTPYRENRDDR